MQDPGVIHKEVQVHQMVTRRAGLGPLGAVGLVEPQVDLVLEQMGREASSSSQANPHRVQLTVAVEEGFSRTMASARTELRVPVSSPTTEISGHLVKGLEALGPMDLKGDPMVEIAETVVSTVEGQAEGQGLVASMETSEVEPFLELERQEDVLPTLVLAQLGGLTQAQEPPEDQDHHQLDGQHRHQLEDQHRLQQEDQHRLQREDRHRLQREDQEAPLQQEGHSRDQPTGQAQEITGDLDLDQPGDRLLRRPENRLQDQRGDQRWDQPENHLEETGLETLEELDPMDDQDQVAKEDWETRADLILETEDHKQDLDLEQLEQEVPNSDQMEAMVLVLVEGRAPMVLEEVPVDAHLMVALSTLEGLKGPMEEGQALQHLALEAQVADQVDLEEGKMVEDLVEIAHQESRNYEEEDSSLALQKLVEGQEQELMALLMEVGLEEDLEPTVEDLLGVWLVEEDLEVLEMEDGLEALETEDGLEGSVMEEDREALELEEGQEVLEMLEGLEALEVMDDLEALEMEEDQEALEAEDNLVALETEGSLEALETEDNLEALELEEGLEAPETEERLEALETEDDLEALEMEDDLEALVLEDDLEVLELEDGQVVLVMVEGQEALALEDEVEALEYQVALVAGTAWAVVLGSVILTLGEAKKCRALAAE